MHTKEKIREDTLISINPFIAVVLFHFSEQPFKKSGLSKYRRFIED